MLEGGIRRTGIAIMNNVRLRVFNANGRQMLSCALGHWSQIKRRLDVPAKEGTKSHPILITVVAHATINLSRQNRKGHISCATLKNTENWRPLLATPKDKEQAPRNAQMSGNQLKLKLTLESSRTESAPLSDY